ncbi:MAG TPA: PhzF family phenazine biosynthesis protein [Methylibium sp.]|uniref:PhzF family phenazine biosynthesis protein n=1 Tax=Methylibium sp. TaxID=2067992 RepID=UPI002DBBB6E7|nr:PhzF family phenazine biosynthesis protein [Methylibium sp.]HEU4458988.1 PhzF family phenazine biosynthesis protein [Methylibium sp.]
MAVATPGTAHRFAQVDVFTEHVLLGNALAVVFDADGLSEQRMQAIARWTNLSETCFLLAPTDARADYRVRIFTPDRELPFAGHPTLGSCHAWLEAGGRPRGAEVIQQCGVGLVRVRRDGKRLAFAAPPLKRSGEADAATRAHVARGLRVDESELVAVQWVDNGPGWVAALLRDAQAVLAIEPDYAAMRPLEIGVVGAHAQVSECAFEVRAFIPGLGSPEDPVTGSLNAGLAQWLIGAGLAPPRYVASQGTRLGRAGRVHVERLGDDVWVGGHAVTCVRGEARF